MPEKNFSVKISDTKPAERDKELQRPDILGLSIRGNTSPIELVLTTESAYAAEPEILSIKCHRNSRDIKTNTYEQNDNNTVISLFDCELILLFSWFRKELVVLVAREIPSDFDRLHVSQKW